MNRPTPIALLLLLACALGAAPKETGPPVAVIVQGRDLDAAAEAVRSAGGEITHELGIIDAVGARLTGEQRARVAQATGLGVLYEHGAAFRELSL